MDEQARYSQSWRVVDLNISGSVRTALSTAEVVLLIFNPGTLQANTQAFTVR